MSIYFLIIITIRYFHLQKAFAPFLLLYPIQVKFSRIIMNNMDETEATVNAGSNHN